MKCLKVERSVTQRVVKVKKHALLLEPAKIGF